MLKAAEAGEPMELAIATDDLDCALGKLWELRTSRDINWQTLLNHAQGVIRQAFAGKCVENLKPDQCQSILAIVEGYLGPATRSPDDIVEVLRLIEDAGFDPYAAISGDQDLRWR